jgi:hypothetical protein
VTQDNIHQTICISGPADTTRPPSSYTTKLKRQQIGEYHYKEKRLAEYEEDHLISLQRSAVIRQTDGILAPAIPHQVRRAGQRCCGNQTKEAALRREADPERSAAIATNWVAAYKKHVHEVGCPEIDEK